MRNDDITFPAFIPPDLTNLPVVPLSHPLPVYSADSVIETGTSGELLQPVPDPPRSPTPRPLPIETWKPSLERRISAMAAQIGAPEWFRCRFDLSDRPAGADHKISLWSDGYRIEFMQGAPAAWECPQEHY